MTSRLFFFFQAEDGIRDLYVTGVQTCALPISGAHQRDQDAARRHQAVALGRQAQVGRLFRERRARRGFRSEERRVGKECRSRWWAYQLKKNREKDMRAVIFG